MARAAAGGGTLLKIPPAHIALMVHSVMLNFTRRQVHDGALATLLSTIFWVTKEDRAGHNSTQARIVLNRKWSDDQFTEGKGKVVKIASGKDCDMEFILTFCSK